MKNLYLFLVLIISNYSWSQNSQYQYTESFTNAFLNPNSSGYYTTYDLINLTGGIQVTCKECTSAINSSLSTIITIDGNGILLRRSGISELILNFPNGINKLSFDYKLGSQVTGNVELGLYDGQTLLSQTQPLTSPNNNVFTFNYDTPIQGSVSLTLKIINSNNINKNTIIDNLRWDEFATASTNDINKSTLSIYPNPANEVISVLTPIEGIKHVQIFDVLGKTVLKANTENHVNISNLKSGIYMVTVTQNNKSETRKLIIK